MYLMYQVIVECVKAVLRRLQKRQVLHLLHGMPIQKNGIYIAPGDFHLSLCGTEKDPVAKLDQGPKRNFVRPSADALFESAAQLFQSRCLAFVLTGMGMDGKDGAEAIKAAGGTVVIQDERSCTVFGMPGAENVMLPADEEKPKTMFTKETVDTSFLDKPVSKEEAAKKEAVEKGKNFANEMGKATDMEAQKQIQNVVLQAMALDRKSVV
mgnify:CR=1 FL=1